MECPQLAGKHPQSSYETLMQLEDSTTFLALTVEAP